jgi:hypothetical protein
VDYFHRDVIVDFKRTLRRLRHNSGGFFVRLFLFPGQTYVLEVVIRRLAMWDGRPRVLLRDDISD